MATATNQILIERIKSKRNKDKAIAEGLHSTWIKFNYCFYSNQIFWKISWVEGENLLKLGSEIISMVLSMQWIFRIDYTHQNGGYPKLIFQQMLRSIDTWTDLIRWFASKCWSNGAYSGRKYWSKGLLLERNIRRKDYWSNGILDEWMIP